LHAGFAADAAAIVEVNDAIGARKERSNGTNRNAGRVGAVIASHHREESPRVREFSLLNVLHPRAVNADGDVVFRFTRDSTGMTADALAIIYDETEVHGLDSKAQVQRTNETSKAQVQNGTNLRIAKGPLSKRHHLDIGT
jgi:hypothetical protein